MMVPSWWKSRAATICTDASSPCCETAMSCRSGQVAYTGGPDEPPMDLLALVKR